MENNDARKVPSDLHERRKQVIRLRAKGHGPMAIAEMTGLSWGAVNKAITLYEQGGAEALKPSRRGRKSGTKRRLSPDQEREIQKLICEKDPRQLKMKFALWTREAVSKLILQQYGLDLSIRAVGDYLARWGFTPQKPIKRAYEQQPEAVREWLDHSYPQIAMRAKLENAEIHWTDETSVVNTDVRGRSFAPRGRTPTTLSVWGSREHFSMISSVNNQGKCFWMVIDGAFNAERFIEFLEKLVGDIPRKVFLIMDNLRVHHCKPVKEWFEGNKERIEGFHLPSYSPELNPDERLNADLKHAIATSVPERTRKGLRRKTEDHMSMIASSPGRVISYFGDQHVRYAADSQ